LSNSFQFDEVSRFTAGALGEPGSRVFYLQAVSGTEVMTLRLEKQQVQTLADYLASMLVELPQPAQEDVPSDLTLIEPAMEEWVVGSIGIAHDEGAGRFVLVIEELIFEDDGRTDEPGNARISITIAQAVGFVPHALGQVMSGRPPCPLCDKPLNPDGHICARLNGHGVH
jgi:uncharacterized repeat protein (TIGR03847 family)